jgi:hypothetical protein
MDHNATIPGLLNLSALRIANDNCVRNTIVPGFAPRGNRSGPCAKASANYEEFGRRRNAARLIPIHCYVVLILLF